MNTDYLAMALLVLFAFWICCCLVAVIVMLT